MAELAQLTITVNSSAATKNIQKLVKSLQSATKPIQQVQKQLSTLDKTVKVMQGGFKGFGGIVKLLTSLLGGLFKGFSSVGKLIGGLVSKGFKLLGSLFSSVVSLAGSLVKGIFSLGKSLFSATKSVLSFGKALAAIAFGIIVNEVKNLADEFQNVTNRLRLAVEAQKDFNKTFARAYTISKQTRTGLFDIADLYTRIAMVTRKLNVSQAQLARVTQLVGKSVAISGASAMTARGALVQLGQAFSIGVLRGDEFRSVQEALPGLLDQVARRLKVTRGELREMAYEGKITSKVLLRTILDSGKALDRQFKNIKPTIDQAFKVVQNATIVFVGRITKALQANDRLFKGITKIADFLDNIKDSTIKGVAIAIENIFGRLADLFGEILKNMASVNDQIKEMIVKAFPTKGLQGLSTFELAVIGIQRAILTAINLVDRLRKNIPVTLEVAGAIASGVANQIKNILDVVTEYIKGVGDNLLGLAGLVGKSFKEVINLLRSELNGLINSVNNIIDTFNFLRSFQKSLKEFQLKALTEGVPGLIARGAADPKKVAQLKEEVALLQQTPEYLKKIGSTGGKAFDSLGNSLDALGNSLKDIFKVELGPDGKKALDNIKEEYAKVAAVRDRASGVYDQSKREYETAQGKLPQMDEQLIKTFKEPSAGVKTEPVGEAGALAGEDFWSNFLGSFKKALTDKGGPEFLALQAGGAFFKGIGDYFKGQKELEQQSGLDPEKRDALSGAAERVARGDDIIDMAAGAVKAVFTGDPSKVLIEILMKLDVIKKVLELVFSAILEPLNALTSFLMPILDELGDMIKAVSEGIMGLVKPLISMLRPFQGIIRLLGGFFKNILKSFSIVLRPIARLLESLLPVLDMLNPILQTIGQVLAAFMSLLGSVIDYFVDRVIGGGRETHDLLMMEQEIIEELTNNTKDLGESLEVIDDAVRSITESALNIAAPAQKLEDAKSRYLELFAAATGEGAEKEDITEFTNFAKTYLKQAQDVLRSSGAYVEIYDAVLDDLDKVGQATFAGSTAVSDFNKANVELQAIGSTIRFDLKDSFTNLIDEVGNHADRITRRLRDYELAEYGDLTPGQIADMDLGGPAPGTYTSGIVALPNSTVNQIVTSGSTGRGTSRSYMSAPLSSSTTPEYTFESAPDSGTSSSGGQTSGLENIGEMAGALLQALIDGIVNAITGLLDILKAFTLFLVEVIIAFITGSLNILKAFGELVSQLVSGAVEALKALAEFYKMLFNGIVNAVLALAEFFKKILGAAVEAIQALVKLYETLFKGIVSAATAFGSIIQALIQGVLSAGSALGSFFSSIFTGAAMGITSVVTSLFNVIFGTSSGGNIVQYLFDLIFSKMITFSSPIGAIPIIPGWLFGQGNNHILQVEFFKDMESGGNVSDVVTGGVAKGPSHQSGMIGTTRDGSPFLFEGGEFIINKKSASAIGPEFLYALNSMGDGGPLDRDFFFEKKANKDGGAHTFFGFPPIVEATGHDFRIGTPSSMVLNIPKDPWRREFNIAGFKIGPLFRRDKLGIGAEVKSNIGGMLSGDTYGKSSFPRAFKGSAGIYTGGLLGLPDAVASFGTGDYVHLNNPFATVSGDNIKKAGPVPLQAEKELLRIPFTNKALYGHYSLNFPYDIMGSSAGFGTKQKPRTPYGNNPIDHIFRMLDFLLLGNLKSGEFKGGLLPQISKFLFDAGLDKGGEKDALGRPKYYKDGFRGFGLINLLIDTFGYLLADDDPENYPDTGMTNSDGTVRYDKKGYLLKFQDYLDRGLGKDIMRSLHFLFNQDEDNFSLIDYIYDLTGNFFNLAGPNAVFSRDNVKKFFSTFGFNKGNLDGLATIFGADSFSDLFGDYDPGEDYKERTGYGKGGVVGTLMGRNSRILTELNTLYGPGKTDEGLLAIMQLAMRNSKNANYAGGGKIPKFDGGGSLLLLGTVLSALSGASLGYKRRENIGLGDVGSPLAGAALGVFAPGLLSGLLSADFLYDLSKGKISPESVIASLAISYLTGGMSSGKDHTIGDHIVQNRYGHDIIAINPDMYNPGFMGGIPGEGQRMRHRGMGMGGKVRQFGSGGSLFDSVANAIFGGGREGGIFGGYGGLLGMGGVFSHVADTVFDIGDALLGHDSYSMGELLGYGKDGDFHKPGKGGISNILFSLINTFGYLLGHDSSEFVKEQVEDSRHRGMGMGGRVKKYASGGMVYGPSHAQGGVLAELEGGEYVLPKYQVGAMVTGQSGYQARTDGDGIPGDLLFGGSGGSGGGGDFSGLITSIADLVNAIGGPDGFIDTVIQSDLAMKEFLMGTANAEGEMEGGFVPTVTSLVTELTKEGGLIPSVSELSVAMTAAVFGEDGQGGLLASIKQITEFNMAMMGIITLFAIGGPIAVGVGLLVAAIANNAEAIMNFVNNLDNAFWDFSRAMIKASLEIPQAIADFLYTTIMSVIFGDGNFAGFQVRMLRNPFTPGSKKDEDFLIKFGVGPKPRNNTDLPLFAREGGYLMGPSHSSGGIPIEAEGGEYIINKRSVSRIGLPFLNQLNRYDEGGSVEQTSSATSANLGSLGFNIRQLPFGDKAAQILGETFMRLGPFNFPFNMAGGGAKIFGRKLFADGGAIDPSGSTGVGAFGFQSPRIGSNLTGHVSARVGGSVLPPRMGGSVDYDPPPWTNPIRNIFRFEDGGVVPRMTYQSGGYVSQNDSELAMAINQLASAIRSQGTTEVNVYTDLEGQTRAAVSEYRAEVRERQARSL